MAHDRDLGGNLRCAGKRLSAYADHFLGFTEGSVSGRGPQPEEGWLLAVCEAFNCTPDVALRQDDKLVRQILEYRDARTAVALYAAGRLAEQPALMDLFGEMQRAQMGVQAPELSADAALERELF